MLTFFYDLKSNFEHAANVACNVAKILSSMCARREAATLAIKDQAYGITKDPITQVSFRHRQCSERK